MDKEDALPINFNVGLSNSDFEDKLKQLDWWDLPSGIVCHCCFNQSSILRTVHLDNSKTIKICTKCVRSKFHHHSFTYSNRV